MAQTMHGTGHSGSCPAWAQKPRPYGVPPGSDRVGRAAGVGGGWSLDLVARVLLEPRRFFRGRSGWSSVPSAAAFAMAHAAVVTVLGGAAGLVASLTRSSADPALVDVVRAIGACAAWCAGAALIALVVTFLMGLVLHPFVRWMGGRGGFGATYDACVYGLAPLGVTLSAAYGLGELGLDRFGASAWLVVAGCAWSVGLLYIAIAELHPLSDLAAFLSTCLPAAALLAVAVPVLSVGGHITLAQRGELAFRTALSAGMRGVGLSARGLKAPTQASVQDQRHHRG